MYVTYDDNAEIVATIIGPDKTYGDILSKSGQKWLFFADATTVNPITDCVDPVAGTVVKKAEMAIIADKQMVRADGADVLTIAGIPSGAAVAILCGDARISDGVVTDGEVQFTTTTAGAYSFVFTCAKYLPYSLTVTAS